MDNFDPRPQTYENTGAVIDFRNVMQMVYVWMLVGMAVTTAISFITVETSLIDLAQNPIIFFGALIGEVVLVIAIGATMNRASASTLVGMFVGYAALNGFTLALILTFYEPAAVVNAFLTTTALFAAMSIIGYTTKVDLTGLGTFLMMALIGLILAMVINIFIGSGTAHFIISILGVLIFTGLTAYDTQKIKEMSRRAQYAGMGTDMLIKLSIMGALSLYLDFINLFLFLLRLFGRD